MQNTFGVCGGMCGLISQQPSSVLRCRGGTEAQCQREAVTRQNGGQGPVGTETPVVPRFVLGWKEQEGQGENCQS